MAVGSSSSSMRSFIAQRSRCSLATTVRFASTSTGNDSSDSYRGYQPRPYSPRDSYRDVAQRPPRPVLSSHFSGKPSVTAELKALNDMLRQTQEDLRFHHLYPLPPSISLPPLPDARWLGKEDMRTIFGEVIRHGQHNKVTEVLNQLFQHSYVAELAGKPDLARKIANFLGRYSRTEIKLERKQQKETPLDRYGRALGAGRRKTATARVWILPSKSALPYLDVQQTEGENSEPVFGAQIVAKEEEVDLPMAEVLVNQLRLPKYFTKLQDRSAILRPLRLTGLLGAYNVFALVKGGGPTGQAEAIAVALAKALVVARPELKTVLYADGALARDPRTVERKKTNLHKANKARTWVKR